MEKGDDKSGDKKCVKKSMEKICGNPGRISGPRNVGAFFHFVFRPGFSALAVRGGAPPLRVRRAPTSGLLPRAVGGGTRALGAVQETSVPAGSRPLSMPSRVAWTGAQLVFRGDFWLFLFFGCALIDHAASESWRCQTGTTP